MSDGEEVDLRRRLDGVRLGLLGLVAANLHGVHDLPEDGVQVLAMWADLEAAEPGDLVEAAVVLVQHLLVLVDGDPAATVQRLALVLALELDGDGDV